MSLLRASFLFAAFLLTNFLQAPQKQGKSETPGCISRLREKVSRRPAQPTRVYRSPQNRHVTVAGRSLPSLHDLDSALPSRGATTRVRVAGGSYAPSSVTMSAGAGSTERVGLAASGTAESPISRSSSQSGFGSEPSSASLSDESAISASPVSARPHASAPVALRAYPPVAPAALHRAAPMAAADEGAYAPAAPRAPVLLESFDAPQASPHHSPRVHRSMASENPVVPQTHRTLLPEEYGAVAVGRAQAHTGLDFNPEVDDRDEDSRATAELLQVYRARRERERERSAARASRASRPINADDSDSDSESHGPSSRAPRAARAPRGDDRNPLGLYDEENPGARS